MLKERRNSQILTDGNFQKWCIFQQLRAWARRVFAGGTELRRAKLCSTISNIYVPHVRAGEVCPLCKWAAPQVQ